MSVPYHVELIAAEFERRKEKNPRYSLRGFASTLELHPSALSRILNCKQDLSVQAALLIIRKLKLAPAEQERFIVSVAQQKYQETLSALSEGAEISQLAAALGESEERYRVLFEFVDQTAVLYELIRNEKGEAVDMKLVRANPAWEKNFSASAQEVLNRPASEWMGNVQKKWSDIGEQVVRTKKPVRFETHIPEVDQWHDAYVIPTSGDRFMILGTNTTERKKRETALRESETLLKTVVNTLPIGVGVFNKDGAMLLENAQMRHYLPTRTMPSRDTARGPQWIAFDERGKEIPATDYPGVRALRGEYVLPGLEMLYRSDDGTERWTRVASVPLKDEENRIYGTFITITDIEDEKRATETLQKSEEQLRTIANIVPDLLWFSGPDGGTLWHNTRWTDYTGLTLGQSAGWGWLDALPPEDREGFKKRYSEAVAEKRALRLQHRILGKDGRAHWFLIRIVPALDEKNHVVHMYGAATDIDDLKACT